MEISTIDILSIIVSSLSFIIAALSFRLSKAEVVKNYYIDDDSQRVAKARWNIYHIGDDNFYSPATEEEKAIVCSHYEFYGRMHIKGYLPFWAFADANGFAIKVCYEKLSPYIDQRRENNPYYAKNFQLLYEKLTRSAEQKKKITRLLDRLFHRPQT